MHNPLIEWPKAELVQRVHNYINIIFKAKGLPVDAAEAAHVEDVMQNAVLHLFCSALGCSRNGPDIRTTTVNGGRGTARNHFSSLNGPFSVVQATFQAAQRLSPERGDGGLNPPPPPAHCNLPHRMCQWSMTLAVIGEPTSDFTDKVQCMHCGTMT